MEQENGTDGVLRASSTDASAADQGLRLSSTNLQDSARWSPRVARSARIGIGESRMRYVNKMTDMDELRTRNARAGSGKTTNFNQAVAQDPIKKLHKQKRISVQALFNPNEGSEIDESAWSTANAATWTNMARVSSTNTAGRPETSTSTTEIVTEDVNRVMDRKDSTEEKGLLRQKKNEKFHVEYRTENFGPVIKFEADSHMTVNDIKTALLKKVKKTLAELVEQQKYDKTELEMIVNLEPTEFKILVMGTDDVVAEENLALRRVMFVQVCNKSFLTPQFQMVRAEKAPKSMVDPEERKKRLMAELQLGTEIAQLVGSGHLQAFMEYENEEIADFRRMATRLRLKLLEEELEEQQANKDKIAGLPEYLLNEPLPLSVPEKIDITCYFKGDMKSKVPVSPVDRVDAVRNAIFKRYCRAIGDKASEEDESKYILKVTGSQEYLHGEHQLIEYDYIRKAISKATPTMLSLVEKQVIIDYLNELHNGYHSLVDDLIAFEPAFVPDPLGEVLIFKVNEPYKVQICSVERALAHHTQHAQSSDDWLFIHAELYHSGHKLSEEFTIPIVASERPKWNSYINFKKVCTRDIPKGTRICFTLYKRPGSGGADPSSLWQMSIEKNDIPLAWVASQVFDHTGRLHDGMKSLRMWVNAKADPVGTCSQALLQMNPPVLVVEMCGRNPSGKRIRYPGSEELDHAPANENLPGTNPDVLVRIEAIASADPLTELSLMDRELLWTYRNTLINKQALLPKFLLSVNWDDCTQVIEAHRLLKKWAKPNCIQALELLDAKFADPTIRDYGVKCLKYMPNDQCYDLLLQLTQVVKHEPYHNSKLAAFLLKKAWLNPKIGHSFYWFLKAEMEDEEISERYTILLESYLRGTGNQRRELLKQNDIVNQLVSIANKIKTYPAAERKEQLHSLLRKMELPARFQLPLDMRCEASGLLIEKCKYMDSKKLPLWLVWKNAEPIAPPLYVIFKVGDDIRQDALTLQMIRVMDKIWKTEGLDLRLQPYGCVATGFERGIIEVVLNSKTTANINAAANGAKAVLAKDTLTKWLRKKNPTNEEFARAQETFALSCAGYCVATCVLGVGDRHNDNIMLSKKGHLFHIDFGHFLGNFKKKFGIERETASFVFTKQYSHILGGTKSKEFQFFARTACQAYNILRAHSHMFITLFQMMLCTGIPELRQADDIHYMRQQFCLGATDEEAMKWFARQVFSNLNSKATVFNEFFHVFVHNKL